MFSAQNGMVGDARVELAMWESKSHAVTVWRIPVKDPPGKRGRTPAGGTEGIGGASFDAIIPHGGRLVKRFLKKFFERAGERWRAVRPSFCSLRGYYK